MNLENRLVLITGASSGIGEASARAFARAGARVVLQARSAEKLARIAEQINAAGGRAHAVAVDVSNSAAVQDAARRVTDEYGVPDVIVNNAGVGRWLFVDETPFEEIQEMIGAPYLAAFYTTRVYLPAMLKRGTGTILNVNSPVCFMPWPGCTGYAGSRGALMVFTQALQTDLHGSGLTVCHFVPGKVTSDYFAHNPGAEERIPSFTKFIPTCTPDQVAERMVRAVTAEKTEVIFPFLLKASVLFNRWFPTAVGSILRATGAQRATSKPTLMD
jgi:short-subunit dehydrogenase